MSKREQLKELEERVQYLKEEEYWAELALAYSILSDLCRIKVIILEDEEEVDLDKVNEWKKKAKEYKQLNKETIPKIDIDEYLKDIDKYL